jgi:hypothetical protein
MSGISFKFDCSVCDRRDLVQGSEPTLIYITGQDGVKRSVQACRDCCRELQKEQEHEKKMAAIAEKERKIAEREAALREKEEGRDDGDAGAAEISIP